MSTYLSAIPAYGRDYTSQKEVKAAWEAGKDFLIQDYSRGGYINKEDKPEGVVLKVRFSRGMKVCVIK